MPERSLSNTLPKARHSLLALRNTEQDSSAHLGHVRSKGTHKKHKHAKSETLNRPWKGHR